MDGKVNRRDFIRYALGTGLVASGYVPLGDFTSFFGPSPALAAEKSRVSVAVGGEPGAMAKRAVEGLGGMGKFVSRGDVVLVKPNIGWDRTPEQAANTNPEVVKAVVAMCLDAGAKKVKVFDRTCNDPRRCYKRSGIEDAVLSLGSPDAVVEHIDERKFVEVPLKNPEGELKSWVFYKDALEVDKAINVPIAKHHNATRLTMGMKNVMGLLGGNRGNIHHDLDLNIAELNAVYRFHLTVLDAVRILTANGPQGGRVKDVREAGTVAASADIVAVDAYGATLFGIKAADIPHLVHGSRLGLGELDLEKAEVSVARMG